MGRNNNFNNGNKRRNNVSDEEKLRARQEKAAKLAASREEDFDLLKEVCRALELRLRDIDKIRNDAHENGTRLNKEDTKISIADVFEYWKNNKDGAEYPSKNRINYLINVVLDLAKCQANTRLSAWHVALKLAYFGEKFQAYFSTAYNEQRAELVRSCPALFCDWFVTNIYFVGTTKDEDGNDLPNQILHIVDVNNVKDYEEKVENNE